MARSRASASHPNKTCPEIQALPTESLRRPAALSSLAFSTTADLEPLEGLMGQRRALEAIDVATGIEKTGFNLFVLGSNDRLVREAVIVTLKNSAAKRARPDDWIYVNNFDEPHKPIAIALPAGRAPAFKAVMQCLIDDLKADLPAVFQSEEYQAQQSAIDEEFQTLQGDAFSELGQRATAKNIALLRTPMGFALVPAREGKVIPPDEFNALSEPERVKMQETIQDLEADLERIVRQVPRWEKRRREETKKLSAKAAQAKVDPEINEIIQQFSEFPKIVEYLNSVRSDLVQNVAVFMVADEDMVEVGDESLTSGDVFSRYQVNLFVVGSQDDSGAPIIEELHPTLGNLTGRVEHIASQGILVTSFRLIKAGALHRANGGFLLLDARGVLTEAFSWEALKRTLRRRTITVEDVNQLIGLSSTISLDPAPIPLDLKVVLFGDRYTHYLLSVFDPELSEHFKVLADFEDATDRTPDSEALMARAIASIVKRENLLPIQRAGVALIVEHAARMVDDAEKLSLSADRIRDLLVEADHYARSGGQTETSCSDVQKALDKRIDRASRVRELLQEQILRQVALISTDGEAVGQINGLSVLDVSGQTFGRPTRITCQVRSGAGKVVDIEREVDLGGPIHSKGVLILSGFMAGRFALDAPMSLHASLVFEQSYSGVDGDSASSAELYSLLSAIAEVPLRQDLAVTGSVNQHGEVQAIGGVNEKIEGFFDICKARGLTGTQGVLIPVANVQHLMLRDDVIDACKADQFAIYPISSIDQGLALMTGRSVGQKDKDGIYPEGSVYRSVEERFAAFAELRRRFASRAAGKAEG